MWGIVLIGYTDEFKIKVIEAAKKTNKAKAGRDYGVSRPTVADWCAREVEIRALLAAGQVVEVEDSVSEKLDSLVLGAQQIFEQKYADKLEELGSLIERKRNLALTTEKILWDHVKKLDGQKDEIMKPEARMRLIKDLNEVRERLLGDPGVIVEVRHKYQVNVLKVLTELAPDIVEEFVSRIKLLEVAD